MIPSVRKLNSAREHSQAVERNHLISSVCRMVPGMILAQDNQSFPNPVLSVVQDPAMTRDHSEL